MSYRQVLLIIVAVILVAIIIVFVRKNPNPLTEGRPGENGQTTGGSVATSSTRAPVPANTAVPEAGAQNLPSGVAAPALVAPAAPSVPYSFRKFEISVQGGKFVPSSIIVNEKDTVHLTITAADSNYDFYQPDYGLASALPKGQTKTVEFGAVSSGKFTFYCQACGGPAKGPVGYITVVPRSQ